MSNPNFIPDYSTNQIYRNLDQSRCLTDDLDDMDDAIEALESGKAATNHTHTQYAPTTHGHTDYAPVSHEHSAYATSDHTHTGFAAENHTHDYAATNHSHTEYAGATHTHAQGEISGLEADLNGKANASHTHAQSEVTGLSDALVGKADANHTHIGYAPSEHNHNADYIPKALQCMKDSGDVEFSFGANSGKNILNEINSWTAGMHTAYAIGGTLGNPDGIDSFRYLVHKTNASIGWVLAFGGQGSAYTNYVHNGVFRGWKRVDNGSDAPLWTGSYYMGSDHTVTPTKKLSDCNKGWLLVWSDYDPDTNIVNSFDQCVCVITKKNASGNNWNGEGYMCVLPRYSDEDGITDAICIKNINVFDDKLVGKDKNKVGENRRDVVLRAVYEY